MDVNAPSLVGKNPPILKREVTFKLPDVNHISVCVFNRFNKLKNTPNALKISVGNANAGGNVNIDAEVGVDTFKMRC